jgi:anti-repressor protein
MYELIRVFERNGKQVVSARGIHEFLEVKNHFTQWFDHHKPNYVEGLDYEHIKVYLKVANRTGGASRTDYAITLRAAKKLATKSRMPKSDEVVDYLLDCEEKYLLSRYQNFPIPQTYHEALYLAADLAKQNEEEKQKNLQLQKTNFRLERQKDVAEKEVLELAPKADFYEVAAQAEVELDFEDMAKMIAIPQLGRNNLIAFARLTGFLLLNNKPYQSFVDQGLFRLVQAPVTNKKTGKVKVYMKTVATNDGMLMLVDYIKKYELLWNKKEVKKLARKGQYHLYEKMFQENLERLTRRNRKNNGGDLPSIAPRAVA